MRGSEPMPRRTSSMSAPIASARFATSFMNEMRVASIELAAYLVSPADGARRGDHVLQVRRAVLARRRAHRDQLQLAVRHARRDVGGKAQPSRFAVAPDDRFQAGLEDGNFVFVQEIYFFLVHIQAENAVARVCEASAGNESYVAGSYDRDVHDLFKELDRIPRFGAAGRSPSRRRRDNASETGVP